MKQTLEGIRLDEELVLKTSSARECIVGSNPTPSVRTEAIPAGEASPSFDDGHQYTRRIDARNTKVWGQRSNLPLLVSKQDNKNTRPRITPGPLCIIDQTEEKKGKTMSLALPPMAKYSSGVSPKLAFEELVAEAFRVREAERVEKLRAVVVLKALASEARDAKRSA